MFEVELKFPLPEPQPVIDRLLKHGARFEAACSQRDVYFRHPNRDFALTDEALRLRSVDEANCITYKGPVVDFRTKTRHEIEVALAGGASAAGAFSEILGALGFRPAREVVKQRGTYAVEWHGRRLQVAIDRVEGLGTYIEIETLAEENGKSAAQEAILTLAEALGLRDPERKSYLGLLLARESEKV
jgi:adenylate cyclase, class 2